jgi:hypothetical protein
LLSFLLIALASERGEFGTAEVITVVVVGQSTDVVVVHAVGALAIESEVTVLVATELTGVGAWEHKRESC